MAYEGTVAELRSGLEIAKNLAKMRIGFVVVPALDKEDFSRLAQESARRLNDLANEAEASHAD